MKIPRLPSGGTVKANDVNDILDKIEKMFRGLAGAGLVFRETPAGVILSSRDTVPIIISDTEPLPQNWPQGWTWIDTSTLYLGKYHQAWLKTLHSHANNNSKTPLTILV